MATESRDPVDARSSATQETDEHGNTIERAFFEDRDRYLYDFELCSAGKGWSQFDTDQDAWYFGVWVHLQNHEIVTYAEGDETRIRSSTLATFAAALESMARAYGQPPPCAIVIGRDGTVTHVFDPRPTVDGSQDRTAS